jgi:hypothetical protein
MLVAALQPCSLCSPATGLQFVGIGITHVVELVHLQQTACAAQVKGLLLFAAAACSNANGCCFVLLLLLLLLQAWAADLLLRLPAAGQHAAVALVQAQLVSTVCLRALSS